jgi:peptide deformylase
MAVLPIIIAPDPRLKLVSAPVDAVDDGVRRLMNDMLDSMYAARGIGLAAPQVGVTRRVIVLDLARDDDPPAPLCLANPEIAAAANDLVTVQEGCLSLPEHWADVTRPQSVTIRYLDYENEVRSLDAETMLATCIQHEMDHLDGILFVDHISSLKRNIILRKLVKTKKIESTET